MVAADGDGEPLRPALIWMDRRAGEECEAARRADRSGAAARADRLQPRPRPRGGEDRLAGAARAGRSTRRRAGSCCPARSWPGGRPASWRSIPPTPRRRCCSTCRAAAWSAEACDAFGVDPGSAGARAARPHTALGPVAPWLREAAGPGRVDAGRAGLRATRWRRRWARAWSSRASCAT